jgi:hypothetical protein
MLLVTGEAPRISPEEDLMQHYQEHEAALVEWSQAMQPNDPRLLKLIAHRNVTIQMLQQQIMAQAQAAASGGAGGGPSPLQPAQVGQPGEPGTFQPATAGTNEARNGSNRAAAGQSPGPTGSVVNRNVGAVVGSGGPR